MDITLRIVGAVAGAVLGGFVGQALMARGGTCPLTCNPVGGAIVGGGQDWQTAGAGFQTDIGEGLVKTGAQKQVRSRIQFAQILPAPPEAEVVQDLEDGDSMTWCRGLAEAFETAYEGWSLPDRDFWEFAL